MSRVSVIVAFSVLLSPRRGDDGFPALRRQAVAEVDAGAFRHAGARPAGDRAPRGRFPMR